MSGMGMPLFGMGAQQYGNLNNERSISDAQNRSQNLIDTINNNNRTITDLKQHITELEKQSKDAKKKKKETERDYNQAKNAADAA